MVLWSVERKKKDYKEILAVFKAWARLSFRLNSSPPILKPWMQIGLNNESPLRYNKDISLSMVCTPKTQIKITMIFTKKKW